MTQFNLLQATHTLLREVNKTYSLRQIATASKLNHGWLADFSRKRQKNPGILHVQQLYMYLLETRAAADMSIPDDSQHTG